MTQSCHLHPRIEPRATARRILVRSTSQVATRLRRYVMAFEVVAEFEDVETAKATGRKQFDEMMSHSEGTGLAVFC